MPSKPVTALHADALRMTDPKPVVCKLCGLLVGWSEQASEMVCIPCFDRVRVEKRGETAFDRVADMFQLLQSKPDEELRTLLVKAGYPPPENRLDAVMNNMRRVFGEPTVTWWLEECGKRGIIT